MSYTKKISREEILRIQANLSSGWGNVDGEAWLTWWEQDPEAAQECFDSLGSNARTRVAMAKAGAQLLRRRREGAA